MKKFKLAAAVAAPLLLTTIGTTATSAASGEGPNEVTFIVYAGQDVEFFVPVVNGAMDAAEKFGVELNVQYADSDNVLQNNLIESAVASEADGIAVSIQDNDAFTDSICAAQAAGVPVISFNVDASEGAVLDCRVAFIGQNFVETGYLIGQRMIEEHGIGEGDLVFAPVEAPEAVYAIQRYEGLKKALDEVGAESELVGVGFDLAAAQSTIVQYLLGRPETAAIIALGSTPLTVSPAAIEEAGLELPIGGFDLTTDIISAIKIGTITATVDQQPYSQGFYAVAQLALLLDYGLYPSSMDTGGTGLVDASNVELVEELVGTVR